MDSGFTNYWKPEAEISGHPLVTKFLQSQARSMNYMGVFNCPKHTKNFCCKHFKGSQLQEVYHPQKYNCACASRGGRGKYAYVWTVKADARLFWAQSLLQVLQSPMEGISKKEGTSARL
jgi:hypothetical protein